MFILTEPTPNPATIKFIPGRAVAPNGTADFVRGADVTGAPLAGQLFALGGVTRVFFGHDFIAVTKEEGAEWPALKPHILAAMMDHFSGDAPIIVPDLAKNAQSTNATQNDAADPEIVAQICELIDTRVRPAVAADGGDITFDRFAEGVVYLQMRGACAGCPSSTATLKNGIENMLRHYIPEVTEVRAVNS